ncbi:MAG: phosphatase PAP2 family protein [Gemmatimonadota bacterium]|nr:phosphatase PAP2 family protein [Gemmatimonadota bacterium]
MAEPITPPAPRSGDAGPERRTKDRGPLHLFWDALFKTLRFIGRRVNDVYAVVGIFIVLGTAVALAAIWVFVRIAGEVREGETQAFDVAVLRYVETHHSPFLDKAMIEITFLGTGVIVLMIVFVSGMFLWLTKHKHSALLLIVATTGAVLLNGILKAGFDRPRPQVFEWGQHTVSSSFPSGHAMSAATVYMTVAYLAARLQRRRLSRVLTLIAATIVVVLIAISRLYLGVHYPTDVAAGVIIGIAWAALCMAMLEATLLYGRRRSATMRAAEVPTPRDEEAAKESPREVPADAHPLRG